MGIENGGAASFESVDPVREASRNRNAWIKGLSAEEAAEADRMMEMGRAQSRSDHYL